MIRYVRYQQVLFKNGNEAYGVEYDRHGERRTALATKEVILSAGTITTPRVLMVSGIGPAEHLHEFGVPLHTL
jgi:choline dehydrogenase